MPRTYSDNQLVKLIRDKMEAYQELLITQVNSGRTQDQSIEPTLFISYEELKTLTGRRRARQGFIDTFLCMLMVEGLEAGELEGEGIQITKKADNLPTSFDSLEEFLETVEVYEDENLTA